ncbi:MAG: hypothetical protein JWQ27_331 [Ferruginibacter sp.]|nr:hypothetical protein [Ferruginibacter sp.]
MFKNIFSFNGRIRRMEYGLTYLAYIIFAVVINLSIDPDGTNSEFSMLYILYIPALWIMLAQGAKRCHDRGNMGVYQLIPFYALWMLFADSDYGDNEYGPNPKGIGNVDEVEQIGNYL